MPAPAPTLRDLVPNSPTFATDADAFFNGELSAAVRKINDLHEQLRSALASGGAEMFVADEEVLAGAVRYSPITSLNYRARQTGVYTVDPSDDALHWASLSVVADPDSAGQVLSSDGDGLLWIERGLPVTEVPAVGAAYSIDAAQGIYQLTLTEDCTLTLPEQGQALDIVVKQSDPTDFKSALWAGDIDWSGVGGAAPALLRKSCLVRLIWIAGRWRCYDARNYGALPIMFLGYDFATTITEPAGSAAGDLFVAISHGSPTAASTLSGWNTIDLQPADSSFTSKLFWQIRGASSLSGTALPEAHADASFWCAFRGYDSVDLTNTNGETVANGATVTRTVTAGGCLLVWAMDRDANYGAVITHPAPDLINIGRAVGSFKGQLKCGPLAPGQSISIQDTGGTYTTNAWRVLLRVTD